MTTAEATVVQRLRPKSWAPAAPVLARALLIAAAERLSNQSSHAPICSRLIIFCSPNRDKPSSSAARV